jgi:dipeptidyl aminopeptidase/acylaminoacyl peptidase
MRANTIQKAMSIVCAGVLCVACGDQATAPRPAPVRQGPEAITLPAYVNVVTGTVTLYGRVVTGGATTETWFEWGTSHESLLWRSWSRRVVSHTEALVSSSPFDSLPLATTYYYRFVAHNSGATRHGETLRFVSPAPLPPPGAVGATMAFVRRGDIYIYSPTNDSTVQLTSGGNFGQPSWSPDGNRIAFGQEHAWPSSIYVINADGSGLQRVGDGWSPAWSPDGRRLAFAALRDGQGAIIVKSLDDPTQPATRIGFVRGQHHSPTWSPDGTRIAFISDWAAFDFAFDVYIANADGSGEVEQLTNGFGNRTNWPTFTIYAQPSWSPDGRSLAVVECDEWQYFDCADSRVAVMSADGSGFRVLTGTAGFARPGWTPDGSAVVFSRTCWYHDCPSAIFEVALDGTNVRLLMEDAHSGVFRP